MFARKCTEYTYNEVKKILYNDEMYVAKKCKMHKGQNL